MELLLLTLLLSAVPLALSECPSAEDNSSLVTPDTHDPPPVNKEPHELFKDEHTYEKRTWDDCESFMFEVNRRSGRNECKPHNSIILGNLTEHPSKTDKTAWDTVVKVCGKEGVKKGELRPGTVLRESKNRFEKVVYCKSTSPRTDYPNCKYSEYMKTDKYIILGCSSAEPVHFHGVTNIKP